MQILKIFRAGNSDVVSIPKDLMKELNLKTGAKIVIGKTSDNSALVIKKVTKQTSSKAAIDKEFKSWLKDVLEEDKEILDELSLR